MLKLNLSVCSALAVALASTLAAGCRDSPSPPPQQQASSFTAMAFAAGTVHPTAENLPERSELAASIAIRGTIRGTGALQRFARRLSQARQVTAFGALEGAPSEVFGYVEDVVAGEDGSLYVLDSRYNNVRVHDTSGGQLGSFGGPGGGPAEFRSPETLRRDARGRVMVADRNNQIKIFEPKDRSWALTGTIVLRLSPEDFCLLGGELLVQGIAHEGFIHAYSPQGARLRSFGQAYVTPNWLVRNQLSDGPIACSEETGTVVTMLKYLPVIYGYSAAGELLWTSQLEDFRPIRIVEELDAGGRPAVRFQPDGAHDLAESLQPAPGGLVIVQTARLTPESIKERKEYHELRTYVVSARTGEGVYVGSHLPRISAVTATRVLAAANDPFPQVRVLELPGEEASQ
jgi:hypothetical protein